MYRGSGSDGWKSWKWNFQLCLFKMHHPSILASGHSPYDFCISKAVPASKPSPLRWRLKADCYISKNTAHWGHGRESQSEQTGRQGSRQVKGCKVCTKEPPGSCNSPGRSDGQDCLFQGIYEEPVLHLNQFTAHSRAACSLSKNSHQSQPSHTSTAAQQTLSSRVTPMHTVRRKMTTVHLNSRSNYFFFPTCCNWVNWQLEMTTCNPLLLQIQ